MNATEQFHAHLNACRQCREHPFGMCATGQHLLEHAATDGAGSNGLNLTWDDVARAAEQVRARVVGHPPEVKPPVPTCGGRGWLRVAGPLQAPGQDWVLTGYSRPAWAPPCPGCAECPPPRRERG